MSPSARIPKFNAYFTQPAISCDASMYRAWQSARALRTSHSGWTHEQAGEHALSKPSVLCLDPGAGNYLAAGLAGLHSEAVAAEIGRANVCTTVTNALTVCRLLLVQ